MNNLQKDIKELKIESLNNKIYALEQSCSRYIAARNWTIVFLVFFILGAIYWIGNTVIAIMAVNSASISTVESYSIVLPSYITYSVVLVVISILLGWNVARCARIAEEHREKIVFIRADIKEIQRTM